MSFKKQKKSGPDKKWSVDNGATTTTKKNRKTSFFEMHIRKFVCEKESLGAKKVAQKRTGFVFLQRTFFYCRIICVSLYTHVNYRAVYPKSEKNGVTNQPRVKTFRERLRSRNSGQRRNRIFNFYHEIKEFRVTTNLFFFLFVLGARKILNVSSFPST